MATLEAKPRDLVLTDRSRVEAFEKCPRRRYWQYEYEGKGLDKTELKLDARIGTWVHNGIEYGLKESALTAAESAKHAALGFTQECLGIVDFGGLDEQRQRELTEGAELVEALVYAWLRMRAPRLLADGGVLDIEREIHVDFLEYGVRLMARPDVVWRRKADRQLFIRNLKTARDPDSRWREKWALDMQTLSEVLAADAAYGETVGGVIIDGLVTGRVLEYPIGSGRYYHNTPLLYAWVRSADPPFGVDEFYPRYEWYCTAPHTMTNGRYCPGGKTHKLSGATKQPVASKYPGGIIGWIDHLLVNDPVVVEEQLIELPPIIRSPYQIERWKQMVLPREADIASARGWVEANGDKALNRFFPMHTAGGNCIWPSKCFAYDLCHGSASADPIYAGYQYREPNHPMEKEQQGG